MTLAEPIASTDHVIGRPAGPTPRVELVEYGDYECPFCARAHHEMTEVLRRVGSIMRYAFRHFPLSQIHPHALLAAQAAEAAAVQGRFWPMHSVLFENRSALAADDLIVYAETIGLDVPRFARELRAGTHLTRVQKDVHSGSRSGVQAVPTFFVDGSPAENGWGAESLTQAIERAIPHHPPAAHR